MIKIWKNKMNLEFEILINFKNNKNKYKNNYKYTYLAKRFNNGNVEK